MSRLVFLDRDGTINVERGYIRDPAEIELLPGAAEAIRRLRALHLTVVVITNQSAIGRGLLDVATLDRVHGRLSDLLAVAGAAVDAVYHCPHLPDDGCRCRKPATGMLEAAACAFGADPRAAFLVGDNRGDIEAGRGVGATTLLVRTGHGERVLAEASCAPDHVVADLLEAAGVIEARLTVGG
jgi:D-glycero-D-manno-heptose 1,7-bisphosphate phosphatase